MIYWFTGQPGHGKTTLAKALIAHLQRQGIEPFHVDGDDLTGANVKCRLQPCRSGSEHSPGSNHCALPPQSDRVVVVSLVAPYRDLREEFKAATGLTEIYVHTTEARGREAKHASDYEAPLERFIDIDTTGSSVESSLASLLTQLPA